VRRRAKKEPVGTTHIRKPHAEEQSFSGDFNVVRVSLGVVDGDPKWLCIHADGAIAVDGAPNGWTDEWERIA